MVEKLQRRAISRAGFTQRSSLHRCNSLRESPAGAKQNKATGGSLLCIKSGRRECANCGRAEVWTWTCGYWFLWLSRHIDGTGRLPPCAHSAADSRPRRPSRQRAHLRLCVDSEESATRRSVGCAVCDTNFTGSRPGPRFSASTAGRSTDRQKKLVCHTCVLESPTRVWDLKAMRQHLTGVPQSRRSSTT